MAEERGAERRRWSLVPRRGDMAAMAGAGRELLERLEERARARRRLAWRTVLILTGVLALLGAGAWLVLGSPVLALDMEDVTVTGVGGDSTVSRGEVLAVVEPAAGTPLARLDTADLTGQLEAITTVAGVQVTRAWPTGLVVDVVARVPVAAAETDGGTVLLDAEGVVVGSVEEVPEGMPLVTVPLESDRAGQSLTAVLTVLAELPPQLRAEVASAGATNPATITLELTDGAQVRWGDVGESALKAAVLEVLREREASVYDLTVPRSPTLSD